MYGVFDVLDDGLVRVVYEFDLDLGDIILGISLVEDLLGWVMDRLGGVRWCDVMFDK